MISLPLRFTPALLITLLIASCAHQIDPTDRARVLAAGLAESPLKTQLLNCAQHKFTPTPFSIAHRGAPLGYPEHTLEGYRAAARMGAGLIECDVTFTADGALVCRHSQCDLHRTTNILNTPLAAQCSAPFTAATAEQEAAALCCTSDITLAEFKQLCGRADHVNPRAADIAGYLQAPASPVTGQIDQCGTLLSHVESIRHIDALGADFVPELKAPQVPMPFAGMSQAQYASKMLEEYRAAGIAPARVHPQSFSLADVRYWLTNHPEYAQQIVYLDPRGRDPDFQPSLANMQALYAQGVRVLAPPIPMLLRLNDAGELEPSPYALFARQAGLALVSWTFENGDPMAQHNWMYANLSEYMRNESQTLEVLHALATQVGIRGLFSDWPGTVTYYANCVDR